MTAAQLRSLTVGRVLACSPVVIVGDHGRRFELVSHAVTCDGAEDANGVRKPTASPVLTLVIRQVAGVPTDTVAGGE